MTVNYDISEDIPYNLSTIPTETAFELTDTAYDVTIDNLPFIVSVSNQNPYRRETAQYRKDQFDNSAEPGEQSLTGWWLRSQTSWHNGAGIKFYEPGTDYQHVSHRFNESRGVNVWNIGEATLLNDVFHSYTGANGIVADTGKVGIYDYIVTGDSAGVLNKVQLNGNEEATVTAYTLASGHGSTNPFKSVTTDGTRYFAVCDVAIHAGNIDGTGSDVVIARHSTGGIHTLKYTKGYLMFGEAWKLFYIPITNPLTTTGHGGSADSFPSGTLSKSHENPNFVWNSIEGGNRVIYAAGYAGSDCEVWSVPFDETTLTPNPTKAIQVIQLPYGEIVNAMQYYLGYLVLATNKGIRVCQTLEDGSVILGPTLFKSNYEFTGIVPQDNYVWVSTTVKDNEFTNACLVRVDISTPFEDLSFPYAYDLQYESDEDSYGVGVLFAQDRLHILVNEGTASGEIQTENLNTKRSSGWLKTGRVRYNTVEPKFFRYINVQCTTGQGDSIDVYTIDKNNIETNIANLTQGLSNQDVLISNPVEKQEYLAFKFVLRNVTDDQQLPTLNAYQIKSTPAARRQRLYQYPLSCFDTGMDRYNSVYGYGGRAIEFIKRLEIIEESGRFVTVTDYRTGEEYQGVIEEVRFTNESSPDKDSSGFGGLLLVTVRKL